MHLQMPEQFVAFGKSLAGKLISVDLHNLPSFLNFFYNNWQVAPLILKHCSVEEGVKLQPEWQDAIAFEVSLRMMVELQEQQVKRVHDAVTSRGCAALLLKGCMARHLLYRDPWDRLSNDIDVLVSPRDIALARDIVESTGFTPSQWNDKTCAFERADENARSVVESSHYELGFYVKRIRPTDLTAVENSAIRRSIQNKRLKRLHWHIDRGEVACYIILDVHHALSLDIGAKQVFNQRVTLKSGWDGPSKAWIALHLIFKIYWEGVHEYGVGSYQYSDLINLVRISDQSDFSDLRKLLVHYNLEVPGFYVLRALLYFDTEIPEYIIQFIDEHRTPSGGPQPKQLNDYGDMWAKIWGER